MISSQKNLITSQSVSSLRGEQELIQRARALMHQKKFKEVISLLEPIKTEES